MLSFVPYRRDANRPGGRSCGIARVAQGGLPAALLVLAGTDAWGVEFGFKGLSFVLQNLDALARNLKHVWDLASAKPLYERALHIRGQTLDPTHPDIATNLDALAEVLHQMGDDSEAEPLRERALRIRTQRPDVPKREGPT